MEHNLILRGYDPATVVPGNINTEKFECLVHLEENTAKLWKDVIAKTYSDIVVEKTGSKDKQEKRNSVLERRKSVASDAKKRNSVEGLNDEDLKKLEKIYNSRQDGNLKIVKVSLFDEKFLFG